MNARVAAIAVLLVAMVAVIVVVTRGGASPYTLDARFSDAGQLVVGDQVQLGGRAIGSVSDVSIARDGLASIRLRITDDRFAPLHEGTRAEIGSPGLSGVANRFVRVFPGDASLPEIEDGGVLDAQHTRGIVDLDTLIDSLDATSRKRLQVILREAADVNDGKAGRQANTGLQYLNPALSRTGALGAEVVRDQAALRRLIASTAEVSTTLAAHRSDLGSSIHATAATLRQIAGRRQALRDALSRAPRVLGQARGTLRRTRATLVAVDPTVRHLRPLAAPLAEFLRRVVPVARNTGPALTAVRRLLPQAQQRLTAFPATARTAVPAIRSATAAFRGMLPVVTGLRAYVPDLIAGFFEGFLGDSTGYYDANGHYGRVQINDEGAGTLVGLGALTKAAQAAGLKTGMTARCPGAATDPAEDRSNPFVPPDSDVCTPPGDPSGKGGRRR